MSRVSTLDDFEELAYLGKGSFGSVTKVRRKLDDKLYVIKNIRISELSSREQSESINEVKLLSRMNSPYVVKYHDSFIQGVSLHIVMEFCNQGDLQKLIKKAKSKNITCIKESLTWNIILQVILGLYYLHSHKVLHRDLKSANIFLHKNDKDNSTGGHSHNPNRRQLFNIKIGDLGVSKLLESSTAFAQTIVGTPYYLSPELCSDQPYRDKSDVWALGVLIYECCTLGHPFEARNQFALIMKILQANYQLPQVSENTSMEIINLITWLLQKEYINRPRIKDILCEEFIQQKLFENDLELPSELSTMKTTSYLTHFNRIGEFYRLQQQRHIQRQSSRSSLRTSPTTPINDIHIHTHDDNINSNTSSTSSNKTMNVLTSSDILNDDDNDDNITNKVHDQGSTYIRQDTKVNSDDIAYLSPPIISTDITRSRSKTQESKLIESKIESNIIRQQPSFSSSSSSSSALTSPQQLGKLDQMRQLKSQIDSSSTSIISPSNNQQLKSRQLSITSPIQFSSSSSSSSSKNQNRLLSSSSSNSNSSIISRPLSASNTLPMTTSYQSSSKRSEAIDKGDQYHTIDSRSPLKSPQNDLNTLTISNNKSPQRNNNYIRRDDDEYNVDDNDNTFSTTNPSESNHRSPTTTNNNKTSNTTNTYNDKSYATTFTAHDKNHTDFNESTILSMNSEDFQSTIYSEANTADWTSNTISDTMKSTHINTTKRQDSIGNTGRHDHASTFNTSNRRGQKIDNDIGGDEHNLGYNFNETKYSEDRLNPRSLTTVHPIHKSSSATNTRNNQTISNIPSTTSGGSGTSTSNSVRRHSHQPTTTSTTTTDHHHYTPPPPPSYNETRSPITPATSYRLKLYESKLAENNNENDSNDSYITGLKSSSSSTLLTSKRVSPITTTTTTTTTTLGANTQIVSSKNIVPNTTTAVTREDIHVHTEAAMVPKRRLSNASDTSTTSKNSQLTSKFNQLKQVSQQFSTTLSEQEQNVTSKGSSSSRNHDTIGSTGVKSNQSTMNRNNITTVTKRKDGNSTNIERHMNDNTTAESDRIKTSYVSTGDLRVNEEEDNDDDDDDYNAHYSNDAYDIYTPHSPNSPTSPSSSSSSSSADRRSTCTSRSPSPPPYEDDFETLMNTLDGILPNSSSSYSSHLAESKDGNISYDSYANSPPPYKLEKDSSIPPNSRSHTINTTINTKKIPMSAESKSSYDEFNEIKESKQDIETYIDFAERTKEKAVSLLGPELFRKVYVTCKSLLSSEDLLNSNLEVTTFPDSRIIQELQSQLSNDVKVEDLCQAVFRVKVLLAVETKLKQ